MTNEEYALLKDYVLKTVMRNQKYFGQLENEIDILGLASLLLLNENIEKVKENLRDIIDDKEAQK